MGVRLGWWWTEDLESPGEAEADTHDESRILHAHIDDILAEKTEGEASYMAKGALVTTVGKRDGHIVGYHRARLAARGFT